MAYFAVTALLYAALLAFVQPAPESLKSSRLSFKDNLKVVKGTLAAGLFVCAVFLLTSDLGFWTVNQSLLLILGMNNLEGISLLLPVQTFTHMFLHHNSLHLLANLGGLGLLGSLYERRVGTKRFFIVLFVGALASAPSIFFLSSPTVVCGISGGVFGLAAAYFVNFEGMTKKDFLSSLVGFGVLFAAYSFLPSSSRDSSALSAGIAVDHLGHLLGAIGAIVFCRRTGRPSKK